MNALVEIRPGGWALVVAPKALRPTLLTLTAQLAEHGPLRVLDGGNRFNAYTVARAARGRPEVLGRITVSRAFTCYQLLSLLESTPAIPVPFMLLDMLSTFYDESVPTGERMRLLDRCIDELGRLAPGGGAVSVHPPAIPSAAARAMLARLEAAAADVWYPHMPDPDPDPLRLF